MGIFIVWCALHIPLFVWEHEQKDLYPPQVRIISGVDIEHPIIRLTNHKKNPEQVTNEIQYLLPKANVPFLTRETETDLEIVPGVAPCYVQVRVKVGQLVSEWSKPIFVPLVEDTPQGLCAKDNY